MPELRPADAVALVVGDLHLSDKAPVSRMEQGAAWWEVQRHYLDQLQKLTEQYPNAVVVYDGDIFHDGWRAKKCSPELINFAIENLPMGYGVPGNHDLPYHRYEDIRKSAFHSLCLAGVVKSLYPGDYAPVSADLVLYGVPWGCVLTPPPADAKKLYPKATHVAVIHDYIWKDNHCHPGVDVKKHVDSFAPVLEGYDVACFGDNHRGFIHNTKLGTTIVNTGAFINRNADEKNLKPAVAVVYSDKSVQLDFLDVSGDRWADKLETVDPKNEADFRKFLNTLETLPDTSTDFVRALRAACRDRQVSPAVERIITRLLAETEA